MTIVSGIEYISQIKTKSYGRVSIKDNRRPNFANNDKTSIQKQIELSVTNGRGYETLLEAIDIVNPSVSQDKKTFLVVPIFQPRLPTKISLYEAYDQGLIPLYFTGPKEDIFSGMMKDSCGEIFLGPSYKCMLPKPSRPPTLVEKLGSMIKVKWDSDCRRRGVFA